jgi:hypothetical protein
MDLLNLVFSPFAAVRTTISSASTLFIVAAGSNHLSISLAASPLADVISAKSSEVPPAYLHCIRSIVV